MVCRGKRLICKVTLTVQIDLCCYRGKLRVQQKLKMKGVEGMSSELLGEEPKKDSSRTLG